MYRLDGTISSIVPGKVNEHISELDFKDQAPKSKYLFHRIRPHGVSILNDDAEKQKEQKKLEENNMKYRKKSHQPYSNKGKSKGKKSRVESGRGSSHSSNETMTKDGSRLTRHMVPLDADEVE